MYVNRLTLATVCTQLGKSSIGIALAERKSRGKVVSNPTERVVWLLLVVKATKREIPDHAIPNVAAIARISARALYTSKNAFKNQLGIPDEGTIYIFLINTSGNILWQTKGDFTEEKNQQLRNALQSNK